VTRPSEKFARKEPGHVNVQGVRHDVPQEEVLEFLQECGTVTNLRRYNDIRFGEVRFVPRAGETNMPAVSSWLSRRLRNTQTMSLARALLVLWAHVGKCIAARVAYERGANPQLQSRALQSAMSAAAKDLGALAVEHFPTAWPYIRGYIYGRMKAPVMQRLEEERQRMNWEAAVNAPLGQDLMPEIPRMKPGSPLVTADTQPGIADYFSTLARSLQSGQYRYSTRTARATASPRGFSSASKPAFADPTLDVANRRQVAALMGGTCSSSQEGEWFLRFKPSGEPGSLNYKHPTSKWTSLILAVGVPPVAEDLVHTLCTQMMAASDYHTVIFRRVDSLEKATAAIEDLHRSFQGKIKHLTINSAPEAALKAHVFGDFISALRPKLSDASLSTPCLFLHPLFSARKDEVTLFAQELSIHLAKVEVYVIKGDPCAAGASFFGGSMNCSQGLLATFVSKDRSEAILQTPSQSEPGSEEGALFDFYDGVTFPADLHLCKIWCSIILECGRLEFTAQAFGSNEPSLGLCALHE
ncbi:unnamed protein product, partial [Effrenium voratum]